jgi:sarcosine oxidase, subunit gamma
VTDDLALARSPLAGHLERLAAVSATTGGAVAIEHVPFLAQVDLRVDPAEAHRSPTPLPLEPNTVWEQGSRAALWLGPNEWLVLGAPGTASDLAAELKAAFVGVHHSVIDVSANRVALELSGPRAKELLSAGCPIDLEPPAWQHGKCAQTLLGRVPVVLHERAESTGLLARPSFAEHLADWLLDATGGL